MLSLCVWNLWIFFFFLATSCCFTLIQSMTVTGSITETRNSESEGAACGHWDIHPGRRQLNCHSFKKKISTVVTNNKVHTLYTYWTEPVINGLFILLRGWVCLLNFAPHKDKFEKSFCYLGCIMNWGNYDKWFVFNSLIRSKQMLFTSAGLAVEGWTTRWKDIIL